MIKINIDKYMIDCNAKRVYLDNIPPSSYN